MFFPSLIVAFVALLSPNLSPLSLFNGSLPEPARDDVENGDYYCKGRCREWRLLQVAMMRMETRWILILTT